MPRKAKENATLPRTLEDKCSALTRDQTYRKHYIRGGIRIENSARALTRLELGWRQQEDMDERDAEKIKKEAARIVGSVFKGETGGLPAGSRLLAALRLSAELFSKNEQARRDVERPMKKIAMSLPVYKWTKPVVRGLGEIGLASIIGEANGLHYYPTAGALCKRLGLAPFTKDGVTKAPSTWRKFGGLTKDDWDDREFGPKYKPSRLGMIYGDVTAPLFRAQWRGEKTHPNGVAGPIGPYGEVYARRRIRTEETQPEWTLAHRHNDALRIMTQELISDLWSEWRKANDSVPEMAKWGMPSADSITAPRSTYQRIDAGLIEALAIAKGEAEPVNRSRVAA